MARRLSARGFGDVSGPQPRDLNAAPTECYDLDGTPKDCPLSAKDGTAAAPDTLNAVSRTELGAGQGEPTSTAGASVIGEDNGLGGSEPTSVTSPVTTGTTMVFTPSATVTSPEPSLAPVGTVQASENDNGLSSGQVAGIAIGTLIIGAVLAFIAAFFLFRRRNKQTEANIGGAGYRSYGDSAPELNMIQKSVGSLGDMHSPYVQVSQTPVIARRSVPPPVMPIPAPVENTTHTDIASFLPPAAQDSQVCERVSALFGKMHEHIERNYRDVHASMTPSMESGIVSFGAKDVNMTELLQECSSPTTALKHALVSYVLSITGSKRHGEDTGMLFPEELSRSKAENGSNSSDPGVAAAASLLRRVSVYLYTNTSGTRESRQSWMAQSSAREAAEHFSLTFFPWANPTSSDQQKDEDLTFIIMEALEINIWLFGQPASYEFKWGGAGRGGVVVSPGLVRRTITNGIEHETMVVEGAVVGM